MRIAYVSTIRGAAWGGSEELWLQSAKKALSEKQTIGIFIYAWPEEPPALTGLRSQGAIIYKRQRRPSRFWRLFHRLSRSLGGLFDGWLDPYRALRSFRPDRIVITDGATWYTANDPWLRELLVRHFAGRYCIVSQGNSAYDFPGDRDLALQLFEKAKKIVFVSENNRSQAFHQLASVLHNTLVIQNPVNLGSYEQLAMPPGQDGCIHFAMIGRLLVSDKGQDLVIAMMAEEFWKKADVRVHIYGKGPDRDYLAALIRYYGVEDSVILEGFAKVEEILKGCHALLMPSICEGTPLTLLEAMALGRVCIATDVGGNGEWIADGENGFLASAPTQALFSQKAKEALANKDRWPVIAEKAHRDMMSRLDHHPGETLYKEIVA